MIKKIDYEAYGKVIKLSGDQNNENMFVGSSGVKFDKKTGLHNMRLRWYSSENMSFISQDIIKQGNRYSYTWGRPINSIGIYSVSCFFMQNPNLTHLV